MTKKIISTIAALVLIITLIGCASTERAIKDIGSSITGLDRTLTVYDNNGNELKKYQGKFDIQVSEYGNQVKFDLNGKRVIIYNAIVVTEEE